MGEKMKLVNTTANIKISTTNLFIANSMMLTEPRFSSYQKLHHRCQLFELLSPNLLVSLSQWYRWLKVCFFRHKYRMGRSGGYGGGGWGGWSMVDRRHSTNSSSRTFVKMWVARLSQCWLARKTFSVFFFLLSSPPPRLLIRLMWSLATSATTASWHGPEDIGRQVLHCKYFPFVAPPNTCLTPIHDESEAGLLSNLMDPWIAPLTST